MHLPGSHGVTMRTSIRQPFFFCFVCFSSGTPLCEKGNRGPSIRSHGLTADARHNELIGGGGVCLSRVWHAGGRRGRRAQALLGVRACMHASARVCVKRRAAEVKMKLIFNY